MDPEVLLDQESGCLSSLYKWDAEAKRESQDLLTPEQVASCVKFYSLSVKEVEGLPQAIPSPCPERKGLKVNLIGGATGSGKTSLIHIAAGGMETPPKTCSDTKCPAVYILQFEGNDQDTFAFLDTAGLCDTDVTAKADVGMQELLINAVAATIQKYELEVVSFLMCMDVAGRLPGNFGLIWPQMQTALGDKELAKLCHFVVTKANGGSKIDRRKLELLPTQDFYQELLHSPLKWPVIHAGRENLDLLGKVIKPISTDVGGVVSSSVNSDSQSLQTQERIADELQKKMLELQLQHQHEHQSAKDRADTIFSMQQQIREAYEELCSLGWCKDAEKARLRGIIDEKNRDLEIIQKNDSEGRATAEQTRQQLRAWQEDFDRRMEEIRRLHAIGSFWRSLASSVGLGRQSCAE